MKTLNELRELAARVFGFPEETITFAVGKKSVRVLHEIDIVSGVRSSELAYHVMGIGSDPIVALAECIAEKARMSANDAMKRRDEAAKRLTEGEALLAEATKRLNRLSALAAQGGT